MQDVKITSVMPDEFLAYFKDVDAVQGLATLRANYTLELRKTFVGQGGSSVKLNDDAAKHGVELLGDADVLRKFADIDYGYDVTDGDTRTTSWEQLWGRLIHCVGAHASKDKAIAARDDIVAEVVSIPGIMKLEWVEVEMEEESAAQPGTRGMTEDTPQATCDAVKCEQETGPVTTAGVASMYSFCDWEMLQPRPNGFLYESLDAQFVRHISKGAEKPVSVDLLFIRRLEAHINALLLDQLDVYARLQHGVKVNITSPKPTGLMCSSVDADMKLLFVGHSTPHPAPPCMPLVSTFGINFYVSGANVKTLDGNLFVPAWVARIVDNEQGATFDVVKEQVSIIVPFLGPAQHEKMATVPESLNGRSIKIDKDGNISVPLTIHALIPKHVVVGQKKEVEVTRCRTAEELVKTNRNKFHGVPEDPTKTQPILDIMAS